MRYMKILVIDGQGGKLGRTLVENILARFPEAELTAVGTNYAATANMMKGGAVRAATGENPVLVACRSADVIVGPLGIAVADSLLGEISPAMANAVAASAAHRILIPMNLCNTYVAGIAGSTAAVITDAMDQIQRIMKERTTV